MNHAFFAFVTLLVMSVSTTAEAAKCGNHRCESGENACNCPGDCGASACGDGICCAAAGENKCNCASDCGANTCGDGVCCAADGESRCTCASDCGASFCGDSVCCAAAGESRCSCASDCGASFCGDGVCCAASGENRCSCASDCGAGSCGDGICCDASGENRCSCASDCGASSCGDEICCATAGELWCNCPDCAEQPPSGGLWATFEVGSEIFYAQITNSTGISDAIALWQGNSTASIPVGDLVCSQEAWNCPWTWHMDPASITFGENAIEVCDGTPSYVEANCTTFYPQYCPWTAKLKDLRDCRTDPSCPTVK